MGIYVGDVGVQLKLATGSSLTYVTKTEIHVTKPNGVAVIWPAAPDGMTQNIVYTTVAGDLDIPGTYILHAYCEWTSSSTHSGAPVELVVGESDLTGLITTFRVLYRYIKAVDLPYENFAILYDLAVDEHAQNLVTYGNPVLTPSQTNAAYCHLISDFYERGNPDFNFASQSISPGVTFSRTQNNGKILTGPRQNYETLMNGIVSARTAAAKPFFHYSPKIFSKRMMEIDPELEGELEHITE
jgi:hypothetical protein